MDQETAERPSTEGINITGRIDDIIDLVTHNYAIVLEKFGKQMTNKFLKDATEDDKKAFITRLKETQSQKMNDKLSLILNRILTDHIFLKSYEEIMSDFKTIEDLKQDNEIGNNHLQSVENESSILQRDTDIAIDKLENVCETILMMAHD